MPQRLHRVFSDKRVDPARSEFRDDARETSSTDKMG